MLVSREKMLEYLREAEKIELNRIRSGVLPELSSGSADHSSAQRYKTDWICLERRLP